MLPLTNPGPGFVELSTVGLSQFPRETILRSAVDKTDAPISMPVENYTVRKPVIVPYGPGFRAFAAFHDDFVFGHVGVRQNKIFAVLFYVSGLRHLDRF